MPRRRIRRFSIRYVVVSAAALAFMATSAPGLAANIYVEALAKYYHEKFGIPMAEELKGIRVLGVRSVVLPCRAHETCKRAGRAFLVGFAEGDGGGQALEFRKVDALCSACITSVATAGGGAMDRRDLMSFGLTAAQAKALIPHDF